MFSFMTMSAFILSTLKQRLLQRKKKKKKEAAVYFPAAFSCKTQRQLRAEQREEWSLVKTTTDKTPMFKKTGTYVMVNMISETQPACLVFDTFP